MKTHLIFLLICLATIPAFADDKAKNKDSKLIEKKGDKEHIYNASYEAVWAACVASAKENFAVETADKENGLITFQTGISMASNGFRVGVSLLKLDDGRVKVKANTQKKMQLVAWGAGGRIADKFFKSVDAAIEKDAKR